MFGVGLQLPHGRRQIVSGLPGTRCSDRKWYVLVRKGRRAAVAVGCASGSPAADETYDPTFRSTNCLSSYDVYGAVRTVLFRLCMALGGGYGLTAITQRVVSAEITGRTDIAAVGLQFVVFTIVSFYIVGRIQQSVDEEHADWLYRLGTAGVLFGGGSVCTYWIQKMAGATPTVPVVTGGGVATAAVGSVILWIRRRMTTSPDDRSVTDRV